MASAEFEIGPETETATHWAYEVTVFSGGQVREVGVTLSFQDYDHWSRGRVPPVAVVEAVLGFWAEREGVGGLEGSLDCSTVGRKYADLEAGLRERF